MDELVDRIALRLRHNAAMSLVTTITDTDARVGLLANVVVPRPPLQNASRQAALELIERRRQRGAAA